MLSYRSVFNLVYLFSNLVEELSAAWLFQSNQLFLIEYLYRKYKKKKNDTL